MKPLDGIRGLAVLMVFFHHALNAESVVAERGVAALLSWLLSAGWMGVDVFFALSGFLITGILLDSKSQPHYFSNFYAKRTLRIFPLYYFALALIFVIFRPVLYRLYAGDADFVQLNIAQLWFWADLQNWYFVILGHGSTVPITHLWSLAVEEQFYLVWPLIVFACSARQTFAVAATICVFAPLLRYFLILDGWSDTAIYMATTTRIDTLLAGALLAAALRAGFKMPSVRACAILSPAIFVGGMLLVALLDHGLHRDGRALQVIGFTTISFSATMLILLAISNPAPSLLNRLLTSTVLRATGKYSYAMYVYHPPILWGLAALLSSHGILQPGVRLLTTEFAGYVALSLTCTYFVSLASWHFFERHFLKLKRYFSTDGQRSLASHGAKVEADL